MDYLWKNLERKYTNNAVTFEKKLYPLLFQLDQGIEQISESLYIICSMLMTSEEIRLLVL